MMKRMWINQPSTLQPLHRLHGVNVLLDMESDTIYFLSGETISMMPPLEALSEGWHAQNGQITPPMSR